MPVAGLERKNHLESAPDSDSTAAAVIVTPFQVTDGVVTAPLHNIPTVKQVALAPTVIAVDEKLVPAAKVTSLPVILASNATAALADEIRKNIRPIGKKYLIGLPYS